MKKIAMIALVISTICCTSVAEETDKYLQAMVAKAAGALGQVNCQVSDDTGTSTITGTAVCIEKSGLMMTLAINTRIKPENITKLELLIPGQPAKVVKVRLLGIDSLTGLSFLQADGSHKFSAIAFMKKANVSIGQRVASVGLTGNKARLSPLLGTGFVAARQRLPNWTVFVTGGKLSAPGSVVFDSNGRAIGLVGSQPFLRYLSTSQRGTVNLSLKCNDQAVAFIPAEEFVYILQNIPQDGKVRRVPWLGVVQFTPVQPELAAAKGISTPAVMVGEVIPGSAADKAGLANRDMIVAMDGKPLELLGSQGLTVEAFIRRFAKRLAGQTVKLTVFSGPEKRDVDVRLQPMPIRPSEAPKLLNRLLGLLLREKVPLDRFLDKSLAAGVPGLLVMSVGDKSPAFKAGIRTGDVITSINGVPVKTAQEAKEVLNTAQGQTPLINLPLTVRRGDEDRKLVIRIPTAGAR